MEKERQLACLSLLYEAVNETCRAGAEATYSSGVAGQEESLSDTETFLCKLAQICDSQKGGDTITALACLTGRDGLEYIICSNSRQDSELNECVRFLTKLLNYVMTNPDELQAKALRKQVLWRILKFNIGRVSLYLKALFEMVQRCINDCYTRGEGHHSPALGYLLAIGERCTFEIDMSSTENSKSLCMNCPNNHRPARIPAPAQTDHELVLSSCENLINIIQDAKAKGLSRILDTRANVPSNRNWSQLRHLFGRLHSYRQAADTIIAASVRRPHLLTNFTIQFVSSAAPARSLVPRGMRLQQLLCDAFPEGFVVPGCAEDLAELEHRGLCTGFAALQHRHRTKTTVHCEVLLHGYLHDQGRVSPPQFLDGACFIATSKPPCKLCHVYFCATALNNNNNERRPFRVRAPHLNMYARWRLPDMDVADDNDTAVVAAAAAAAVQDRNDVLEDMVEQMQSDTVALLRDKRATWRRNDSRTDTHAGFQSALGMMMSARGGRGASVSADDVTSTRSQTEVDMAPPRYTPVGSAAPSIAGSWGCQSG
ncbi:hypothetical protein BBAD15_g9260 [Beauveria bassiana D1-5]|uniref:Uncharacterized protein n=1 Tax=Beauveria bassiana D1-5 TaxID=1245745 RepID=A0A0A2VD87_BEABA|nr:hypothetical protein BBAD15_g9260 [Beauveria bassiana D1-5]